ncbi:MAG: enoyl-CoA hydratase/isomerase family protein, partial [Chloroflexota bacterium]
MPYTAIVLEKKDHIATITLNRPRVLNAVDAQMAEELDDACQNIEQDKDIRAAIITGAGDRAFCTGIDLSQVVAGMDSDATPSAQVKAIPLTSEVGTMMAALNCPVIAAINGYALGLGLAMALACDIRIVADNALLGAPDL